MNHIFKKNCQDPSENFFKLDNKLQLAQLSWDMTILVGSDKTCYSIICKRTQTDVDPSTAQDRPISTI